MKVENPNVAADLQRLLDASDGEGLSVAQFYCRLIVEHLATGDREKIDETAEWLRERERPRLQLFVD